MIAAAIRASVKTIVMRPNTAPMASLMGEDHDGRDQDPGEDALADGAESLFFPLMVLPRNRTPPGSRGS